MSNKTYKVIELIGASPNSWEEAARGVVEKASSTLHDLRVAEISNMDIKIDDGKILEYRVKVKLSFKYDD